MFTDFMSFLVAVGLLPSQVHTNTLLAFMEYLCQNNFTPANISNYLAGIRAYCVLYNISTTPFRHEKIQMFIKSLKINRPLSIKNNPVLTHDMLLEMIQVASKFEHPHVFTALYLLAFFSFLRLSNLVPHTFRSFDVSRHLARGDVIFSHDMAVIIVKWSKTLQCRDTVAHIHIPVVPGSRLCPVSALKDMLNLVPGSQDDPLFTIYRQGHWLPLTDTIVRKHLKRVTRKLGWEHMQITFHTFRKSGASWAFQRGVPIDTIKKQGTWKSDCVWRYIHTHPTATPSDPLLQAFRLHLPS